jgi:hypothetical protein
MVEYNPFFVGLMATPQMLYRAIIIKYQSDGQHDAGAGNLAQIMNIQRVKRRFIMKRV